MVGLSGQLLKRLNHPASSHGAKMSADKVLVGRPMTWYKATFQAPLGSEPVVVDLQGLGKGHASVNGGSIDRYWVSALAPANGCGNCNYCGDYSKDKDWKCWFHCGNPSQRHYHIPRSLLNGNGTNTLVLFEEIGGNVEEIAFQIVTICKVCAKAYQESVLELTCQGGRISEVEFASYGDQQGACEGFKRGSFEATNSFIVVEKACVGRQRCLIDVCDKTFGMSEVEATKLAVQAVCS